MSELRWKSSNVRVAAGKLRTCRITNSKDGSQKIELKPGEKTTGYQEVFFFTAATPPPPINHPPIAGDTAPTLEIEP